MVGAPAPRPRTIFAVVCSITGPFAEVTLPPGSVDWEVELVVVLGRGGRDIAESRAWDHVAGVPVGEDLSERELQHSGPGPQFSLTKSHSGFSPTAPHLVTIVELVDPDDPSLGCAINGDTAQDGRTRDLIFPVPDLLARQSRTVELLAGDVVFTGTPSAVGVGRTPPRFLQDGDVLISRVGDVGRIEQRPRCRQCDERVRRAGHLGKGVIGNHGHQRIAQGDARSPRPRRDRRVLRGLRPGTDGRLVLRHQ